MPTLKISIVVLAQPSGDSMITADLFHLARAPPFCRLAPHQLREILDLSRTRHLPRGALIFDEGQPARRFHLLLSGHIRLVRMTVEGDQIIVLHVPAGQIFGIGIALGQPVHQETAIAAEDCLLLSWPNRHWAGFSAQYDGFAAESLRAFGARAGEMSNRIVELSTKLVEQRIACALLRLIGQSGRRVAGGIEIGFALTRQNIADMTGTTLHSVSRVMSAWEKQGLVSSTRGRIVVTDPHRMVTLGGAAGEPAAD